MPRRSPPESLSYPACKGAGNLFFGSATSSGIIVPRPNRAAINVQMAFHGIDPYPTTREPSREPTSILNSDARDKNIRRSASRMLTIERSSLYSRIRLRTTIGRGKYERPGNAVVAQPSIVGIENIQKTRTHLPRCIGAVVAQQPAQRTVGVCNQATITPVHIIEPLPRGRTGQHQVPGLTPEGIKLQALDRGIGHPSRSPLIEHLELGNPRRGRTRGRLGRHGRSRSTSRRSRGVGWRSRFRKIINPKRRRVSTSHRQKKSCTNKGAARQTLAGQRLGDRGREKRGFFHAGCWHSLPI